jgi:hypothetical protein
MRAEQLKAQHVNNWLIPLGFQIWTDSDVSPKILMKKHFNRLGSLCVPVRNIIGIVDFEWNKLGLKIKLNKLDRSSYTFEMGVQGETRRRWWKC